MKKMKLMKCKNPKCENERIKNQAMYCRECLKRFSKKFKTATDERQQDKIQCKICGKYFIQLAVHTYWTHGLTGREYRKIFGYDVKKGLIPESYRKDRQALNKKHPKVLENIKNKGAVKFQKGQTHHYKRSDETVGRLVGQFNNLINNIKGEENDTFN